MDCTLITWTQLQSESDKFQGLTTKNRSILFQLPSSHRHASKLAEIRFLLLASVVFL